MSQHVFVQKPLHFVGFDIPSKHIQNLTNDMRDFINAKRWEIWYHLRMKLKARMIQESLWKIPDDKVKEASELIERWRKEYRSKGLEVSISIYPIQTTQSGLEWFDDVELLFFLDWLSRDLKLTEKDTVSRKTYLKFEKKRDIIEESIKEDYSKPTTKQKKFIKQIKETINVIFSHLFTVNIE